MAQLHPTPTKEQVRIMCDDCPGSAARADAERKRQALREREALRAQAARLAEEGDSEAATRAAVEARAPARRRLAERGGGAELHGEPGCGRCAAAQGGGGAGALMLPQREK
jgi:hypothetical protein